MAASTYQVWLTDDSGQRLAYLENFTSLEYVKVVNGVGQFTILLPSQIDQTLLRRDRQIHIYRKPPIGPTNFVFGGILTRWQYQSQEGAVQTMMAGQDQNVLLLRRINAWYAGHANSVIVASTTVDDGMKEVIRDNFGSGAGTGRDWSAFLTVQADSSDGPTVEKSFAWRKVIDILKDLNAHSRTNGDEVFFGIYVVGFSGDELVWEFRTNTDQPGENLAYGSGGKYIVFSRKWGNLEDTLLEFDYTDEANTVYAGGQGEGSDRSVTTVTNDDSINLSRYGRSEVFYNASSFAASAAALTDAAESVLNQRRGVMRFSGSLLDTKQARYGVDWDIGDRVTAFEFGRQFDGIIRKVHVRMGAEGEQIVAKLEGEYILP